MEYAVVWQHVITSPWRCVCCACNVDNLSMFRCRHLNSQQYPGTEYSCIVISFKYNLYYRLLNGGDVDTEVRCSGRVQHAVYQGRAQGGGSPRCSPPFQSKLKKKKNIFYKHGYDIKCIFKIYFWNKTLHVSDSSSVHHEEFFTVHTAMVYVIKVCLWKREIMWNIYCWFEKLHSDVDRNMSVTTVCCGDWHILRILSKSSPVTGLDRPRGFQEVKAPRFRDDGTGWW